MIPPESFIFHQKHLRKMIKYTYDAHDNSFLKKVKQNYHFIYNNIFL